MAVRLRRSLSTPNDVSSSEIRLTEFAELKISSTDNRGGRQPYYDVTSVPPIFKPAIDITDRTLFAVYSFFKNFIR